jgi:hypothetical protein
MDLLLSSLPLVLILFYICICVFIIPKIFKNPTLTSSNKYLWSIIVLGMPFIGLIAYFMINKSK